MRHSALSWRLAVWLSRVGGLRIRDLVLRGVERALEAATRMPESALVGLDVAAWHDHGRLVCQEAKSVVVRAIDEVVRPSLNELASASKFSVAAYAH